MELEIEGQRYEAVRHGNPEVGDLFVNLSGCVVTCETGVYGHKLIVKAIPWRAKVGENYYTVGSDGDGVFIVHSSNECGSSKCDGRWSSRNYYKHAIVAEHVAAVANQAVLRAHGDGHV